MSQKISKLNDCECVYIYVCVCVCACVCVCVCKYKCIWSGNDRYARNLADLRNVSVRAICFCMHTRMHTYIHHKPQLAHTCRGERQFIQTYIHIHIHIHIASRREYAFLKMYKRTNMHACINTYPNINTYTYIFVYTYSGAPGSEHQYTVLLRR
jgi:hypothetical protein